MKSCFLLAIICFSALFLVSCSTKNPLDDIPVVSSVAEYEMGKGLYITRIYSDEAGESHFSSFFQRFYDVDGEHADIGRLSSVIGTAGGFQFRFTTAAYNNTWHTAPQRQFVINLDASVRICVSSGSCRVFPAGTILFFEDIHGKGHSSEAVFGEVRHSLVLPVSQEYSAPAYALDESEFTPYPDQDPNQQPPEGGEFDAEGLEAEAGEEGEVNLDDGGEDAQDGGEDAQDGGEDAQDGGEDFEVNFENEYSAEQMQAAEDTAAKINEENAQKQEL
jgi:hypothetical protein